MNTINLIRSINLNLPTVEQILEKYKKRNPEFSENQAKEYLEAKRLIIKDNLQSNADDIEFIIYNTNISSIGIGGINFRQKIKPLADNTYQFASYNDYYFICYDKSDDKIICFTEDSEVKVLISPSTSLFLSFLYTYYMYDIKLIFNYDSPQGELKKQLSFLIKNGLSENWVRELIDDWPW